MNPGRYAYIAFPIGVALLCAGVVCAVTAPLVSLPAAIIITDGVISGILLAVIILFSGTISRAGIFSRLHARQKHLNYIVLALISAVLLVGVPLVIIRVSFSAEAANAFIPLIPVRMLLGLAVFYCTVRISDRSREEGAQEEDFEEPIPAGPAMDHVAVKKGGGIEVIDIADIEAILAEGDYVMIYTPAGRFLKEQTMKYFAENLPEGRFVRVHRSAIVNLRCIERIESYEKGRVRLILKSGMRVNASTAGYRELRAILNL